MVKRDQLNFLIQFYLYHFQADHNQTINRVKMIHFFLLKL